MPNISVVIPVYNRADLLRETLASVLTQTVSDLEVLVCDDGSQEDIGAVVASFADHRLILLPGLHSGLPAVPRNRGIVAARGRWVAFLDSDDLWLPHKLELQLAAAERLGCRAVCADAHRLHPDQGRCGLYLGQSLTGERLGFSGLLQDNLVIASSALLQRSLFDQIGGFPEDPRLRALEDYACWLRAAVCTAFAVVTEPLLDYRDDPGASIRSQGRSYWQERNLVLGDFIRWAKRFQDQSVREPLHLVRENRRHVRRQLLKQHLRPLLGRGRS